MYATKESKTKVDLHIPSQSEISTTDYTGHI